MKPPLPAGALTRPNPRPDWRQHAVPPLGLADIRATAELIAPFILETPTHVWRSRETDDLFGAQTELVLKLELFQRSGSFKIRGALANMLRLSEAQRELGVTAVSSGNHAIAVACAASILRTRAKVVMLSTASPDRIAAARAYGADVVIVEGGVAAFAEVDRIATQEGRVQIHPFEGRQTSLGSATLGLEFARQAGPLDAVIVAVGGGGLASGVASAFKLVQPSCQVIGVEPEGACTMHLGFAAGAPQTVETISTIAGSLAPPMALPHSFALCRDNLDGLVKVDDDQLCAGMALMFRDMKLAVEPAAAAALAALVGPLGDSLRGRRVGLVICGANIDVDTFGDHVRRGQRVPLDQMRRSIGARP